MKKQKIESIFKEEKKIIRSNMLGQEYDCTHLIEELNKLSFMLSGSYIDARPDDFWLQDMIGAVINRIKYGKPFFYKMKKPGDWSMTIKGKPDKKKQSCPFKLQGYLCKLQACGLTQIDQYNISLGFEDCMGKNKCPIMKRN